MNNLKCIANSPQLSAELGASQTIQRRKSIATVNHAAAGIDVIRFQGHKKRSANERSLFALADRVDSESTELEPFRRDSSLHRGGTWDDAPCTSRAVPDQAATVADPASRRTADDRPAAEDGCASDCGQYVT